MKNSRLELRAISEFNFMLRFSLYLADLFANSKKKKKSCQEETEEDGQEKE